MMPISVSMWLNVIILNTHRLYTVCSYLQAAGPVPRAKGLHSASSRRGLLSGSGSYRCCTPDAYASRGEQTLMIQPFQRCFLYWKLIYRLYSLI